MIIRKDNVEISVGKAVGHVLEDLIVSAEKRLWIISPWISPKYAEFLLKQKDRGIDVKLITTNDYVNESHREALKILIERKVERKIKISWLPPKLLLILGLITLILGLGVVFLLPLLFGLGVAFLLLYFWRKVKFVSRIPLTIIDKYADFTHVKMYLIDDKLAVVGSANLTESGLWRNVESITILRGEELAKKLEDIWHILEKHPMKKLIPIEIVGREIYQTKK